MISGSITCPSDQVNLSEAGITLEQVKVHEYSEEQLKVCWSKFCQVFETPQNCLSQQPENETQSKESVKGVTLSILKLLNCQRVLKILPLQHYSKLNLLIIKFSFS